MERQREYNHARAVHQFTLDLGGLNMAVRWYPVKKIVDVQEVNQRWAEVRLLCFVNPDSDETRLIPPEEEELMRMPAPEIELLGAILSRDPRAVPRARPRVRISFGQDQPARFSAIDRGRREW